MPVFGFLIFSVALLFPIFGFAATPSQYGLQEGDLISASGDPDIYIINEHGFKRLFLNPAIFGFYGHLRWENVKGVSAQTRDAFPTSLYFKNCEVEDPRVYAVEVTGEDTSTLHWLNASSAKIEGEDSNFSKKVFCINDKEFRWYSISGDYSSTSQVSEYRRGTPSATVQTSPKEKKLVRVADDPRIYYLAENGVKKHIISPEVFESYGGNKWEDVVVIDKTELNSYPTANLFRRVGDTSIYKLEDGKKRLIPDAETFNGLGLDWEKVVQINELEFGAYPSGDVLTIPEEPSQEPSAEPEATQKVEEVTQKSEEPSPSLEDTIPPPQQDSTLPEDTAPQDTQAPTISNISISNLTESTASINWTTDEPADGQIEFGTSACPCANNTPIVSSLITTHVIDLFILASATTYHYRIKSKDAAGNSIISPTQTFKTAATPPPQDVLPPVRSAASPSGTLTSGTTQTNISFATNESAACRYATTPVTVYDSMTNTFTGTGGISHLTLITGLTDGTSYTYYVRCKDTAGNKNTSDFSISFSVVVPPPPLDTTPPLRSNHGPSGTLAYTTLQTNLSLTTNEDSICRYSKNSGTNYDSMSNTFPTTGGTSHSVQISGLAYGESYNYYVRCVDAVGNKNTNDILISFSVATLPISAQTIFLVKPYLVYPADKAMYSEYETSVKNYLIELQNWYRDKVGKTFVMNPLQVVRSSFDYLTMRCGPTPSETCLSDPSVLEGNWGMYMNKAAHGGVEQWEEQIVALIFSAGGGGYAGANQYTNFAGFAITGDWVVEPISGIANTWGIPCSYSDVWQCAEGVPRGTPAHELGHAFGVGHPDPNIYTGSSIMKWHGDYPTVGFLQHEIDFLLQSSFFL